MDARDQKAMDSYYEQAAEIQEVAEAVIQARDFCGNEMAALIEWEKENRKLTVLEHKLVAEKVAEIWEESKLAARKE